MMMLKRESGAGSADTAALAECDSAAVMQAKTKCHVGHMHR